MPHDFMDEVQPEYTFSYFASYFWSGFKAGANVAKFFFPFIGGCAAAAADLYDIYNAATTPRILDRKSRIAASVLSFCANGFYTAASFFMMFNPLVLIAVACSSALPSVAQSTYAIHLARKEQQQYPTSSILHLDAKETHLKSKCANVYKILKVLGSAMIFASLFFPPLFIPGLVMLGASTALDHFEQQNDYNLIKKCFRTTPPVSSPYVHVAPRNLRENMLRPRRVHPRYNSSYEHMKGIKVSEIDPVKIRLAGMRQRRLFTSDSPVIPDAVADVPNSKSPYQSMFFRRLSTVSTPTVSPQPHVQEKKTDTHRRQIKPASHNGT